ncbi:hypothetical protein L6452_37062 [Arctium lappa]|uniref:Uncharacterized protein n=1 Tax=Arctium lappa TaxID=4217 RepID=A0ACB8Y1Y8_ARCLA|nr:hypothetical protein L6452_37062 [Arctium lappa]
MNRDGGTEGRGGGCGPRGSNKVVSRGGRALANATATSKSTDGTRFVPMQVKDSDRSGLMGLSDDQWTTLVNLLNSSKGQSLQLTS